MMTLWCTIGISMVYLILFTVNSIVGYKLKVRACMDDRGTEFAKLFRRTFFIEAISTILFISMLAMYVLQIWLIFRTLVCVVGIILEVLNSILFVFVHYDLKGSDLLGNV